MSCNLFLLRGFGSIRPDLAVATPESPKMGRNQGKRT
jgi:hypothetical protein